jgi:hypothetical protein
VLFNPDPATLSVTGGCNIDGSGTFSYVVTGTATGPYPGPFKENGVFTFQTAPPLLAVRSDASFADPDCSYLNSEIRNPKFEIFSIPPYRHWPLTISITCHKSTPKSIS